MRRTYQRDTEIHVMLNVLGAEANHELDAVSFSPGEGVLPTLFPIRDRIQNLVYPASVWRKHQSDPPGSKVDPRRNRNESKNRGEQKRKSGIDVRALN